MRRGRPNFADASPPGHAGAKGFAGESHFGLRVVSEAFEGLKPLARHQKIYAVLADEMRQVRAEMDPAERKAAADATAAATTGVKTGVKTGEAAVAVEGVA